MRLIRALLPAVGSAQALWLSLALLPLGLALAGCGVGTISHEVSGSMAVSGIVHGGQQGVQDSTVQMYRVGASGNGSTATPMLTTPVSTDASGFFHITGDYHCVNAADQIYMVSSGGNPGLAPGTDNQALVLIDALGNCGNLSASSYITINEVTTAAAAWSLAPFIASFDHIGASVTNAVGIRNAMLGAQQLADPETGVAATLPANLTTEPGKLYALADALASCVNSDGGSGCTPLFTAATPSGGSAPTNTLNAAVNIVLHPGQNVAAVFDAITPSAPFPTTLTAPPHDWTMSLTVTGGDLNVPGALAVDAQGDVWAVGQIGSLSAFTPQGTPLSTTGYGIGTLSESFGLTIDTSGNIWVTNEEQPQHSTAGSVTKFMGSASATPGQIIQVNGSPYIYDASVDYPYALSADTNGDVMAVEFHGADVTVFNSGGAVVASGLGQGNADFPTALAVDQSHGVWIANQSDDTVTHVAADGSVLARPACCGGSDALAMDRFGNVWSANFRDSSVSEIANNGTVPLVSDSDGGVNAPSGIAVDAAQNVWVANFAGASFSELAGNSNSLPAGAGLSPDGGYGLDASLLQPTAIAPDATGSLWVANEQHNDIVKFFGIATPTATPVTPTPAAP